MKTVVFDVTSWSDLNSKATRYGWDNDFKSWTYDHWEYTDNPIGSIPVAFFSNGRGRYTCGRP